MNISKASLIILTACLFGCNNSQPPSTSQSAINIGQSSASSQEIEKTSSNPTALGSNTKPYICVQSETMDKAFVMAAIKFPKTGISGFEGLDRNVAYVFTYSDPIQNKEVRIISSPGMHQMAKNIETISVDGDLSRHDNNKIQSYQLEDPSTKTMYYWDLNKFGKLIDNEVRYQKSFTRNIDTLETFLENREKAYESALKMDMNDYALSHIKKSLNYACESVNPMPEMLLIPKGNLVERS